MNDCNEKTNHHPTPVQSGLELVARRLDEQRYPGQAWPPITRVRRQAGAGRSTWWITTCVAAAALALAVTLLAGRRSVAPGSLPEAVADRTAAPAATPVARDEAPVPHVFMVEDLDSYSIIAVTDEMAVVSFATKGGPGPEWLVALPSGMAAGDR